MPIPLPLPLTQENIRPQEDGLKVTQTPRGTRRDERGFHGQHNKSRDAVAAAACLQNVIKIINASFDPSHRQSMWSRSRSDSQNREER